MTGVSEDDRDYGEYTITDPDENLDILQEEDEDEQAEEEDFYREPAWCYRTYNTSQGMDLYYNSTLLMNFQQPFNVIKQPFKNLKKQNQMCHFYIPSSVLPCAYFICIHQNKAKNERYRVDSEL